MHTVWWFFGMHLFWWIFWISIIAVFFSVLTPVPKSHVRSNALAILQRRYAAGEISTEEYDKRKAVLIRDGAAADESQ